MNVRLEFLYVPREMDTAAVAAFPDNAKTPRRSTDKAEWTPGPKYMAVASSLTLQTDVVAFNDKNAEAVCDMLQGCTGGSFEIGPVGRPKANLFHGQSISQRGVTRVQYFFVGHAIYFMVFWTLGN